MTVSRQSLASEEETRRHGETPREGVPGLRAYRPVSEQRADRRSEHADAAIHASPSRGVTIFWSSAMSRSPSFRTLLDRPGLVMAPGAFDAVSAMLIERAGFPAVYVTGYGVSASRVGLPDAGLVTLDEMLDAIRAVRRAVSLPIIADGDTGFGNILNVRRTVREYEAAGASAIQIEDQVAPKRCGHTLGREVIDADEMVRKIEVARESRSSPELLVVARTDARTPIGLEEALRRGRLYAESGADVVFVESPESEEELARIAADVPAPTLANMVEGGRTPLLDRARLEELGFRVAIYPATGFLAAARAMREAFASLLGTGDPEAARGRLEEFEDFNELIGFDEIDAFVKRHA